MNEATKNLRLQEWARQVDDWQASGMTQRDWCKVHGIGYDAFKYRKAKLKNMPLNWLKTVSDRSSR